mgnify:CR=1 FL=1
MAKGDKGTAKKIVYQHPQGGRRISINQHPRRNKKNRSVPYGTKQPTLNPPFDFQKAFRKMKRVRFPFLN